MRIKAEWGGGLSRVPGAKTVAKLTKHLSTSIHHVDRDREKEINTASGHRRLTNIESPHEVGMWAHGVAPPVPCCPSQLLSSTPIFSFSTTFPFRFFILFLFFGSHRYVNLRGWNLQRLCLQCETNAQHTDFFPNSYP